MATRTIIDNIERTRFITFTCQYWLPLFVWNWGNNPVDYMHSSAKYYINGEQGIYLIQEP